MLFLLALGTWLRLIFIDKPDGLWNDEYVSWYVASIPYGKAFWQAVFVIGGLVVAVLIFIVALAFTFSEGFKKP